MTWIQKRINESIKTNPVFARAYVEEQVKWETPSMSYFTRFAPSPTGNLHIGGARTAIFNYLVARASGGIFKIRFDDTDQIRSKQEYKDNILRGLEWLGLEWQEVFHQSSHLDVYKRNAEELVFYKLAKYDDDNCIVLNLDKQETFSWIDKSLGEVKISEKDFDYIKNSKILRSDGSPLYNFASIVDDTLYGTDYIIRGVDHVSNTSLQVVIKNCLLNLWEIEDDIEFCHVGLITHNDSNKKISKRDNLPEFFLDYYIDNNYDPKAVVNSLLRLSWGPKNDNKENSFLTLEEAASVFLEGNLKSNPCKLNKERLDFYNRKLKSN
jgi:glutamyl-tRNA synthetase